MPLIGKDTIKEALFDALGTGDRAWSRRLGLASYQVLFAVASEVPAAVVDANFGPGAGPRLLELGVPLVEVFCRCPAAEVERRFAARASSRHPGHIDHVLAPGVGGVEPLRLGPVLEVDTSRPVEVAAVVDWVRLRLEAQGLGGGPT